MYLQRSHLRRRAQLHAGAGNYTCTNSNLDDDASTVVAFHDARYCTGPDLQHNQAPSMNTSVPTAPPPTASEPGCS